MKQTGFTGIAEILGEAREVEFRGNTLTFSGFSQHEARAVVASLERTHYGVATSVGSAVDALARNLEKTPSVLTGGAYPSTASELADAGGRGVARESIETKVAEPGDAKAPAKKTAPAAPPANGANGVKANGTTPPIAPHVATEYPGHALAPDAERDQWVKLAAKELTEFRANAPAYLDESWAHLLRTAPVGWFAKHLAPPKVEKAKPEKAKPDLAKEAAEKTASARRAVSEDVTAAKTAPTPAQLAASAPVLPPEVVAEIRAAFGINPGLLAPPLKQILVDAGVEDGLVPPALAGDLDAAWPALCDEAPAGWFQQHAESVRQYKEPAPAPAPAAAPAKGRARAAAPAAPPAAAAPSDPGGLVDEGVDPDEDPIVPPAGKVVAGVDVAALKALPSFRDVLSYLAANGVKTQSDMVKTCLALKKDVESIERVADLASRIPRALQTIGIELPAS